MGEADAYEVSFLLEEHLEHLVYRTVVGVLFPVDLGQQLAMRHHSAANRTM